jgi:hypothetical protein
MRKGKTMKQLLIDIEKLATEELTRSYEKFPAFNSSHEGYAVITEELEELVDEIGALAYAQGGLWAAVKKNDLDIQKNNLVILKQRAIQAASEAIQVSAMAQKFLNMEDKP